MNNLFELVVGDGSGDGNGQTNSYFLKINKSSSELWEAYAKGVRIVEVDLENEVNEYQQRELTSVFVEAISKYVDLKEIVDEYEGKWSLDTGSYVSLWLLIAKLGNPSLKYQFLNPHSMNVGGAGLLSN